MPELLNNCSIWILLIIFTSSLLRSSFGFGDALLAMPLLALIIDIKTATPIVALIGFLISLTILIGNWKEIKFRENLSIIIYSILGIPLGLFFLKGADENLIKIVLAGVLILFSSYNLLKPGLFHLKNNRWAFAFGLFAGALGGAYNTNGPPIIIFGTLRKWKPAEFRLLLQGIFTPVNFFIIIGHGANGLWTKDVLYSVLCCIPIVLIAIFLGSKINRKINKEKFTKYVYIFLLVIAVVLLVNSV